MADEPRYRLTAPAHIAPHPGGKVQFLEAGTDIVHVGTPGWHMEPLNDTAKAVFKKLFPDGTQDPERTMLQNMVTQKFDPNKISGVS